jgi:hypothetical protein
LKRLAVAVALASLASAVPVAVASDGASVTQHYEPADGRVHTDVSLTFTGGGGSQYTPYVGAGTVRVTFPQAPGVTLPSFDQAHSADPEPLGCRADQGAYDQDNTGFICNFKGEKHEAEILFPSEVVLHFVSAACYPFPDVTTKQPARVDVWAAQDVTDAAPDATYAIASSDPCSVPPPPPVQTVPDPKTTVKTCKVPSLTKLTLKKATSKLKKAGCQLGKVTRAFSTKIKNGLVISQSPKATKKVKRGAKVNLKVSNGPKKR